MRVHIFNKFSDKRKKIYEWDNNDSIFYIHYLLAKYLIDGSESYVSKLYKKIDLSVGTLDNMYIKKFINALTMSDSSLEVTATSKCLSQEQALDTNGLYSLPETTVQKGTNTLTQLFGGVSFRGYSNNGGSRLILGTKDDDKFVYRDIDCRKQVDVGFDVDISTLPAGVVYALYLVPMKFYDEDTIKDTIKNNAVGDIVLDDDGHFNGLEDEWGIGYGDAQYIQDMGTIEIDILECSTTGMQATLHGYIRNDGDDIIEDDDGVPQLDRAGIWKSIHGMCQTDQNRFEDNAVIYTDSYGDYNAMTFGPGESFKINSLKPFRVECSIYGGEHPHHGKDDVIKMQVSIMQGSECFIIEVESKGFPVDALEKMHLVSAIWATEHQDSIGQDEIFKTSWWLDGFRWDKEPPRDFRGWCTTNSSHSNIKIVPHLTSEERYRFYSYANKSMFLIEHNDTNSYDSLLPVYSQMSNLSIVCDTDNDVIDNDDVWVLDYMYRGLSSQSSLNNWHGTYGSTYGVFFNNKDLISGGKNYLSKYMVNVDAGTSKKAYIDKLNTNWNVEDSFTKSLRKTLSTDGVAPANENIETTFDEGSSDANVIKTTFKSIEVKTIRDADLCINYDDTVLDVKVEDEENGKDFYEWYFDFEDETKSSTSMHPLWDEPYSTKICTFTTPEFIDSSEPNARKWYMKKNGDDNHYSFSINDTDYLEDVGTLSFEILSVDMSASTIEERAESAENNWLSGNGYGEYSLRVDSYGRIVINYLKWNGSSFSGTSWHSREYTILVNTKYIVTFVFTDNKEKLNLYLNGVPIVVLDRGTPGAIFKNTSMKFGPAADSGKVNITASIDKIYISNKILDKNEVFELANNKYKIKSY